MALREKIYLNRDNAIKLGLTADGMPVDAHTMTRVVVKLTDGDGTVRSYDSTTDAAAFDFYFGDSRRVEREFSLDPLASNNPPDGEHFASSRSVACDHDAGKDLDAFFFAF